MDRYELASVLADEILAHALESYPNEACGIIAGTGDTGIRLYRGHNLSRSPRVAFELDPTTLAQQIEFEHAGLEMTGIYHSHPAGPDKPSLRDVEQVSEGYPDSVSIVCSLEDISKPVLRAFRISLGQAREIALVGPFAGAALTNRSQRNTLLSEGPDS